MPDGTPDAVELVKAELRYAEVTANALAHLGDEAPITTYTTEGYDVWLHHVAYRVLDALGYDALLSRIGELEAERDRLAQWKARIIGEYGEYHTLRADNKQLREALEEVDDLARTWVPAVQEPYGKEAWELLDKSAVALGHLTAEQIVPQKDTP